MGKKIINFNPTPSDNLRNRLKLPADDDIPTDPNQFYQDVGLIIHPRNTNPDGSPQLSKELTPYQYRVWKDGEHYRYRLTIKSQKIGLSTSAYMEVFQRAVLPRTNPQSCRGYEILVIGQTFKKAEDHLRDIRNWVLRSEKYKGFIRTHIEEKNDNDITTKSILIIENPDDPTNPTRIIALGLSSEASIWSWKRVKFIHMSDVAASDMIDDSGAFAAAFSRLINTRGSIHIESPPRGQRGKVWDIYQRSKLGTTKKTVESQFKINEIPANEAVTAGLMAQEDLDQEKVELGPAFTQYYMCDFMSDANKYYADSLFQVEDYDLG